MQTVAIGILFAAFLASATIFALRQLRRARCISERHDGIALANKAAARPRVNADPE